MESEEPKCSTDSTDFPPRLSAKLEKGIAEINLLTKEVAEINLIQFSGSDTSEAPQFDHLPNPVANDVAVVPEVDLLSDDIPLDFAPDAATGVPEANPLSDLISSKSTAADELALPDLDLLFPPPLRRPPLPYKVGWKFTIQAHVPREPSHPGQDWYKSDWLDPEGIKAFAAWNMLQMSGMQGPAGGTFGEIKLDLEVCEIVQVGEQSRAQMFKVVFIGASSEQMYARMNLRNKTPLLARLFDPVYFEDARGALCPFFCSDHMYIYEVDAYRRLQDVQGTEIPKCYGSFSFSISASMPGDSCVYEREVRMILLEVAEGQKMAEMDPSMFSSGDRQAIISEIIDIESNIYARDVIMLDLSPENIIIDLQKDKRTFDLKLMIDSSNVFTQRDKFLSTVYKKKPFENEFVSPIIHWDQNPAKFSQWIDWEWDSWLEKEFGASTDTITGAMRCHWGEHLQRIKDIEERRRVQAWLSWCEKGY